MKNVLKIGIGTTSDAKIEGIKRAFEKSFPNTQIEIVAKKTESEVADQPFGKDTSKGALNRVKNLVESLTKEGNIVDYYVSCEAGIDNISIPGEFFSEQVVYIYNKELRRGFFGKSSSWSIPREDISELKNTDLDQYLIKRDCTGLQDVGNGTYITRSDAVEEGARAAIASEMIFIRSQEKNMQIKESSVMEERD